MAVVHDDDERRRRLAAWLSARLPEARNLVVAPFEFPKAGNSAESILVDIAFEEKGISRQQKIVVRRQYDDYRLFLHGTLERQWQMLSAIAESTAVPVPSRLGMEMDPDLLGGAFFVTGHVEGRIPADSPSYNDAGWLKEELDASERLALWHNGLAALAAIHTSTQVDRFGFLHRPEYGDPSLEAYLKYVGEWHNWVVGSRSFPAFEAALDYLGRNLPRTNKVGVLWGDARPGNIIFRKDRTVAAVLDWEMAMLGPPEVDLGWWLMFNDYHVAFSEAKQPLPGLPNRRQSIDRYEELTGWSMTNMEYFVLLAWLEFAIIHCRWLDRMIAHGKLPQDTDAYLNNVAMLQLMQKLGMDAPVPASA